MELKTCPNCGKKVMSLITDAANGKRYCYQCIPNPESCPGAVFVSRKMDKLHAASMLETYSVEQRLKDLKDPPRCECGAVLDALEGQLCSKCEGEAFRLAHRQRRAPIEQRQPDDRPDYFAPAPSAEDVVLRRIKGNYRRQMISKSIRDEGLASIPELWCAHDISESFKEVLTSTAGPRARGGEDLPDLAEGEVEIARLSLVDSVHGEVTSLRAKRDPKNGAILLSMVDEYEMEFKLLKRRVSTPLTAVEVLAVFRDANPSPLATSCQLEFSSFFYSNLNVAASEMVKKSAEEPPDNNDPLTRAKARAFARVVIANQLGLEADCIRSRSDGHPYLVLKIRETIPQDTRIKEWLTLYHAGVEAEKLLYGSYTGDGSGEIEDLAQEFHLDKNHLLQASQTATEQRETNHFRLLDVKKIVAQLQHRLAWAANNKEAALNEPYHLFFFSAIDRDGGTRFFDVMKQEDGFSLAETATSAPRLGRCVETVYGDPGGGTHHVHRIYGKYGTMTSFRAMQDFASLTGLTQIKQIAETRTLREAGPSWKFIYEKLGCPTIAFTPKFTSDYRTAGDHSTSNAVQNRRILVVHHEQLIADFICKLLQQDGYETRMECSSVDAIRASGELAPRLLIIDPVMPDILGLDAAKQIFDQTQCKVLLVSAGASNSDFAEILGNLRGTGCDCAALALPFEKEDLLELVRSQILSDTVVPDHLDSGIHPALDPIPKDYSPEPMIDFATMTPVMPDAELPKGFVRVIMPNGKCFDILEELWTKAREIEPGCVIMSLKATGKKHN